MNLKAKLEILKEPRGFIKIIELFIAIFAFSTTVGYTGHFEFQINCLKLKGNLTASQHVAADFSYNFKTATYFFDQDVTCNTTQVKSSVTLGYKSESEYFVFVGVTCFLYVIGVTLYYILFEDQAEDSTSTDIGICSLPVVDFVVSVVFVIFWFTASIAWAAGLTGLKDASNVSYVVLNFGPCREPQSCRDLIAATYGALNVSVLLGFLNCVLWGFNLWFLFKETPWHSPRRATSLGSQDTGAITQETPPASAI